MNRSFGKECRKNIQWLSFVVKMWQGYKRDIQSAKGSERTMGKASRTRDWIEAEQNLRKKEKDNGRQLVNGSPPASSYCPPFCFSNSQLLPVHLSNRSRK